MSFSAKADMDKVCSVDNENSPYEFINENCRRNNVLVWNSVSYDCLLYTSPSPRD